MGPRRPATTSLPVKVTVLSVKPSGHDVEVDFEATGRWRFQWSKLVLTAPDGTTHTAYRPSVDAAYDQVNGTLASGCIFQFPSYQPGRYTVSYEGKQLDATNL